MPMKIRTAWLAALAAGARASSALADDGFETPQMEQPGTWKVVAVLLVALAAVCVVAFKNAKRTHLD